MTTQAYKIVEDTLRDAVTSSKSPEEFAHNLRLCQIVAQRMLAVLIFNSATNEKSDPSALLEKVGIGIKQELNDITEAAKDQKNLSSVDVDFGAQNEH